MVCRNFWILWASCLRRAPNKGLLSRLQKELITLGLALFKNCQRCVSIHSKEAARLDATAEQLSLVKKIIFFMRSSPHSDSGLWEDWVDNWKDFSYSRITEKRQLREMVALAIAIVMQHEKQIELHLTAALDVGVSIEEVFEVVPLVMLMDGAPTLSQIPKLVTCYEEYSSTRV